MNATLTSAAGAALIFFVAVAPAAAAEIPARAIGAYEQKGDYWQRVKIAKGKKDGQFLASFEVATRGCQGDVKMAGAADGPNRMAFSTPSDAADGGVCKITVTFSSDFGSIEVSHPYCGLSGAACDFNGKLKRSGKR